MPDPTLDTPELEHSERHVSRDRQAINAELPYHPFVQSEFPQGKGQCDQCGGGPDAPIHHKPVDQLERIADALERISCALEEISWHQQRPFRVGAFRRIVEWCGNFFWDRRYE